MDVTTRAHYCFCCINQNVSYLYAHTNEGISHIFYVLRQSVCTFTLYMWITFRIGCITLTFGGGEKLFCSGVSRPHMFCVSMNKLPVGLITIKPAFCLLYWR